MRKIVIKCVVIGDPSVGKSSLLEQFVNRKFSGNYKGTIGNEFLTKEVLVKNQFVLLQLWDTSGQARFSTRGNAVYRRADVCVVVFDVTRKETFDCLQRWYDEFFLTNGVFEYCPVILIGNKADLERERVVTSAQALRWCQGKKNSMYTETSAKEFINVEQAFNEAARIALEARGDRIFVAQADPGIVNLDKLNNVEEQGNCAC